jgi:Domain of unknown function (DUF4279)
MYTVGLRFFGDTLEPSQITKRLNIQPTTSHNSSDNISGKRRRRPFWDYNGEGEEGFQYEWLSLEQGLDFLLQRLSPVRVAIVDLSQEFEGLWWCGHFQANFDGGPTLSPRLLAQIASYGLPLFIDNYFSSETK